MKNILLFTSLGSDVIEAMYIKDISFTLLGILGVLIITIAILKFFKVKIYPKNN